MTSFQKNHRGYTVVEMMVTIVIVAVLAAVVGTFLVKLLTLQEREREEAYIREKLADICGSYADLISVGSYFNTRTSLSNQETIVTYRLETGGISLETGLVSRVAQLVSSVNKTNSTMDISAYSLEFGEFNCKMSRHANGVAPLIPLVGDMVSCRIVPLNEKNVVEDDGFSSSDAVLGYLQVAAQYEIDNDEGETITNTVTAGRVVRLWNRE